MNFEPYTSTTLLAILPEILLVVLAGLVIFVLLGLHMAVMHLDTLLGWFNPEGIKPIAFEALAGWARARPAEAEE